MREAIDRRNKVLQQDIDAKEAGQEKPPGWNDSSDRAMEVITGDMNHEEKQSFKDQLD